MYLNHLSFKSTVYLFVLISFYLMSLTNQQSLDSLEYIAEAEIENQADVPSMDQLNPTKFNHTEQNESNKCNLTRKNQCRENKLPLNDNSDKGYEDENEPLRINTNQNSDSHEQRNENRKNWRANKKIRRKNRCKERRLSLKNVSLNIDEENNPMDLNTTDLNKSHNEQNKNNCKSNRRYSRRCRKNNQHVKRFKSNEHEQTEDNFENKDGIQHKSRRRTSQKVNYICRCEKILQKKLNKNNRMNKHSKVNITDVKNPQCKHRGKKRKEFCEKKCIEQDNLERNKTHELNSNSTVNDNMSLSFRFLMGGNTPTTENPKTKLRTRRPMPSVIHSSEKKIKPASKDSNIQEVSSVDMTDLSLRPKIEMKEGVDTIDGSVVNTKDGDFVFGSRGNKDIQNNTYRPQINNPYNRPTQLNPPRKIITTRRPVLTSTDLNAFYFPTQNNNMNIRTTQKPTTNPTIEFRSGQKPSNNLNTKECIRAILMCCRNPADRECFYNLHCEIDGVKSCSRETIMMARQNFFKY